MYSNVSEEARLMSVRVLRWNEALEKDAHQRYPDRGLFYFLIASEFTLNGYLYDSGMVDVVMLFPIASLLSPRSIEKTVRDSVGLLSTQLLSQTIHNLGTDISNYLNNHFHFELDTRKRGPKSVIVVEVYRSRNIVYEYDERILNRRPRPLFPPSSPFTCYIDLDRGDIMIEEVRNDLRFAIGLNENPLVARKRIVDDEPLGLVQVAAIVVQRMIGLDACKTVGSWSCPICLEEFSSARRVILKTACSHIFHGKCINHWLSLSMTHSCPVCRFQLPLPSIPGDVAFTIHA